MADCADVEQADKNKCKPEEQHVKPHELKVYHLLLDDGKSRIASKGC